MGSVSIRIWSMSVIAFHEKAGRSQVGYSFLLNKVSFSSAELSTLSPPFHPHSRGAIIDSLGASWVFSFQPVLPPDCRPLVPWLGGTWARR